MSEEDGWGPPNDVWGDKALAAELQRLRSRVVELETALRSIRDRGLKSYSAIVGTAERALDAAEVIRLEWREGKPQPTAAYLWLNSWAGVSGQEIFVVGETPKFYRIRPPWQKTVRLPGYRRTLTYPNTALVPKESVHRRPPMGGDAAEEKP